MSVSKRKKAQSTAEYVIVLGLVVGAVVAMQTYVKRGLQARVKEATDYTYTPELVTKKTIFNGSLQYEPYYLKSDFTSTKTSESTEDLFDAGSAEGKGAYKKATVKDDSLRTGDQTIVLEGLTEAATRR